MECINSNEEWTWENLKLNKSSKNYIFAAFIILYMQKGYYPVSMS